MAFITLSRKVFFNNLDIITERIGSIHKVALVLKDNAYGHGLLPIAQLGSEYGVRYAVVRNLAEASAVERFFDSVLVLDETPKIAQRNISFTVNALDKIEQFARGALVELKVDSGMHRNGIAPSELAEAFARIKRHGLTCKGVFTHYRSADALSSELFWQRQNFESIKAIAQRLSPTMLRFHSANSAALFRGDFSGEDLVRVGIAAYGCLELDAPHPAPPLQPVLSLWAERQSSRSLQAGMRMGYNATATMPHDGIISAYDVGYADGLHRSASNRYTAPNGARQMGRISMDNTLFTCKDEELCIFDNANRFAQAAGTIGYEILTGMNPNFERRIVD
ncbi:MAG: alanine racemase [Campylobacterales bacterium]|nr:alanine racemase [Campylobacterales bacterium]